MIKIRFPLALAALAAAVTVSPAAHAQGEELFASFDSTFGTELRDPQTFEAVYETSFEQRIAELADGDARNIFATIPSVKGARVVDIGAGIGRFTGEFAKTAKHVRTVDFVESFMAINRQRHQHLDNVTFDTRDAMQLDLPDDRFVASHIFDFH